ncbi:MAG: OsmC family protein [Elusimicrobiaceae bacterium]|nr:OsmC family protein [Elusimicrobiaceae bacterium]
MLEAKYVDAKKVEVRVNNYIVHTDMPREVGGDNSAPNPFEMFMASFLACQAVFAMAFVEKNNMKKEDFSFRAEPVFDDKGLISKMTTIVKIPSDFPTEKEATFINVLKTCKVGKHITFEKEILLERSL